MKLFKGTILLLLVALCACGGDSLEDLVSSCGDSNLKIENVITTNSGCDMLGSIEVQVSGGSGNYEYSLTGAAFQTSRTFNVSAGGYTIYVRDTKGCSINKQVDVSAEAGSIEIVSVSTTPGDCSSSNGTIEIEATGGTGSLFYQLDAGSIQSSTLFSGVSSGQHTVTVVDDLDCIAERQIWLPSGVSLSDQIMPIVMANCANSSSCHSSGSPRVDLSNPLNVISHSSTIKTRTQNGTMPPRGRARLSQENIDLIACWVDDGALNN